MRPTPLPIGPYPGPLSLAIRRPETGNRGQVGAGAPATPATPSSEAQAPGGFTSTAEASFQDWPWPALPVSHTSELEAASLLCKTSVL